MFKKIFLGLLLSGVMFQEASAVSWTKFLPKMVQSKIEAKEAARREYADKLVSEYEMRELAIERARQDDERFLKQQQQDLEKATLLLSAQLQKQARKDFLKKAVLIGAPVLGFAAVAVKKAFDGIFILNFDKVNLF